MAGDPPLLLLDACCAINLLATGRMESVLRALPYRFAVAEHVLDTEVLHLGERDDETGENRMRSVTLKPLVEQKLLEVLRPTPGGEVETFVSLALELDDGEAVTAALSIHRGGQLATDDRKAIRVLGNVVPSLEVRRTSQLLRAWAEQGRVSGELLRQVLVDVEQKASFVPPRDDPEAEWWVRNRGTGSGAR